ncbi:uncharacterized protein BX664DRAFT_385639 [Halteromyces radiatus]|uniref:uncharacterized protein n=1 Tax=Halteromyces radiatus TaxID=101107 RepID=UPI00221F8526|nr:uncharacterized protein BX664DRAFT_385639 [Halteromyces radiatus]KAI8089095.1 hypothetical protein BX664DRAFT_385639 [Halteromyces radiatus]
MDGFFPDDNSSSTTTQTHNKKARGEQSLRPVTVKQLQNVQMPQEGTFFIDDVEISQIRLVGVIRDVNEQSTNVTYRVEDGTGSIEVKKWIDQNESSAELSRRYGLLPDKYVRISARLNSFNNRISLMAFDIRAITDYNEISYHLLDATYNHIRNSSTKDYPMQDAAPVNSLLEKVFTVIQSSGTDEGIHIDQLISSFHGQYPEAQIREAADNLYQEGRVYNTVDDDHFKCTDQF